MSGVANTAARAAAASLPLRIEPYQEAIEAWPRTGQVILAQYDKDGVWVYQAYQSSIATYAARQKRLEGAPGYNMQRMSWIKTNFLWMQYRSGWCSKQNQEHGVAICLKRAFFDVLVNSARTKDGKNNLDDAAIESNVRLQWDPDHDPAGAKCERRAIQLGLRKSALACMASGNAVLDIIDITDFVVAQRDAALDPARWKELMVPVERPYTVSERAEMNSFNNYSTLSTAGIQVCIFLGGGFNPLHTQHIALMEQVKQYLETTLHWTVTKGYFVPSCLSHISKKEVSTTVKDEHRIAICRAALAEDANRKWLECADKPYGSADEFARKIVKEGSPYVIVVGGDRAVSGGRPKWLRPWKTIRFMMPLTVCVRRGEDPHEYYQAFLKDKQETPDKVNPNFHFLEASLPPISSTAIRERINQAIATRSIEPVHALVEEGVIARSTAEYIEANLTKLYASNT